MHNGPTMNSVWPSCNSKAGVVTHRNNGSAEKQTPDSPRHTVAGGQVECVFDMPDFRATGVLGANDFDHVEAE